MHAHDIATILDREGVAVRAGHHCAQVLMERFGVASTTRASFGLYNSRADVDTLMTGLTKAREILAQGSIG
jgi:cysteine desulfurase/selenocysteine lyase